MVTCRVARKFAHTRNTLEACAPELIKQMLPGPLIRRVLDACGVKFRRRHFTPAATMWLWVRQRLQNLHCRHVAANAFAWAFANDQQPTSTDSSAYCKARGRQSQPFIQALTQAVGEQVDLESDFQAFGRPAYVVDGATIRIADTPANQQAYPQPPQQKSGCGFPVVRVLAIFSLATGVLRWLATGSRHQSEQALFYSLWAYLPAQAILIGDRYFESYRNMALLLNRGMDCLMKLNQSRRQPDFRKCHKRLGKGDGLFLLNRPRRERWALQCDYDEAPETLLIRMFRYTIHFPGFRAKRVVLTTTLLDAQEYPPAQLAQLYARRWGVELNIRHIKTTMGMCFIDARSPAMARKEIWMWMLAYNVIRRVMQDASVAYELPLEQVSFKGAMELLLSMADALGASRAQARADAYEFLLFGVAQRPVRARPNRREPRVMKMRKSKYTYMTQPRCSYDRRTKSTEVELRMG